MSAPRALADPLPPDCPLVETHLHLEGSIPPRLLRRLAARAGRAAGGGGARHGVPFQRGRGFDRFLDAFVFCAALLRDRASVESAAGALLDALRREGVRWADVTVSPQTHLRRGLSFPDLAAGLAAARGRARRLGGPGVRFIVDGGRLWGPAWFEWIVEQAAAHRDAGIAAIGLGGEEEAAPARAFRRAFERARRLGLATVAHAGEGTSPRRVREAIDELGVVRIGHGIAAAADRALLRRLERERIVLEICPTSNVMTGAVRSLPSHPLARILDAGVRVTLGADDRTIFGTDLRREFAVAGGLGAGREAARAMLLEAAAASLAPPEVRHGLRLRIRRAFRDAS